MPDPDPGEMPEQVETPTPQQPKEQPAEITSETKDASKLEAELEKTRKALKDANKEAADRRKRLDELEKAEQERQQAQMSEQEKLQARLKELENANAEKEKLLKEKDRQELQRKVAKAVGLPDGFAERLRGETEEDLKADATSVLELLPKQEAEKKPVAPKLDPTNPGNGKQAETAAQKKGRILGTRGNVWDGTGADKRGGGVVIVDKD